jgi:hypothetical protein
LGLFLILILQENEEMPNAATSSSFSIKDFTKSHPPRPEEIKRKPTNPFSKDIRKFDKPRGEEKPKFGKPFPTRNEASSSSSYSQVNKNEKLDSAAIEKPIAAASSTTTSSTIKTPEEIQKQQQADSVADKGKKKIIKKIIRVKKVIKPKTGEEGGVEGGVGETTKKPVASTSSTYEGGGSSSTKPFPKPGAPSTDKKPGGELLDDPAMKRRRARPDMQIYRPGSLRTSKDTSKDKPNNNNNNKPQDKSGSSSFKPTKEPTVPEQDKT